MTAVLSFDIIEYLPQGYNFKGFTFNFKMDKLDETIEFKKKNTIKLNISNLYKDRKFVIRIYRTGSLIGISELQISNQLFEKREEEYIKTVNVIMTDSIRSELFGIKSSSKTFQLSIKTKIEYDVDPFGDDTNEDGQQPVAYNLEEGGPQRITVVSQAAKGFSKRALMEQNEAARMSVYALKTREQDFMDHDQTFIDPIFDDEHEDEFQNEDGPLNSFLDQINEKFSSDAIQSETNEEVLREKCRDAVMAVFEAQKIYYTAFYKTQSLNRLLRELLVKYNQKYRIIFKKYNRLREQFETNGMKKNITALNTDENKRIVAAMEQSVNELDIYRKLFNVAHDDDQYQTFKADLPGKEERQRNLMIKVIKGINESKSNLVPEEHKLSLNYVVGKYKLHIEHQQVNADDSGNNTDNQEEQQVTGEEAEPEQNEEAKPEQQEEAQPELQEGNEEPQDEAQEEPQEEAPEEGGEAVEEA